MLIRTPYGSETWNEASSPCIDYFRRPTVLAIEEKHQVFKFMQLPSLIADDSFPDVFQYVACFFFSITEILFQRVNCRL
jgi:hypothetical protein